MPLLDNKDKRKERQEKKDIKLGEQVTSEAKGFGVNLDKPPIDVGPMSSERKAAIDKRISEAAQEDLREGLGKFQQLRKAPEIARPEALDKERLKQSLRREKRARIGDILTSFGRGLQRKSTDPSMLQAPRIRKEREAMYEKYKSASQGAKQRLSEWESKYTDEQIAYLEGKLKDKSVSPLEKQKIKLIKAQIEKTKAETAWKRRQPTTGGMEKLGEGEFRLKGSTPYTSLLYSLTDKPETLFPPLKGDKTYTPSLKEDRAKQVLLQMYDIKSDAKGNPYLSPKEGKEGYLGTVSEDIERQKRLVPIEDRLYMARMELEQMGEQGTAGYEFIDKPKREKLVQEIKDLEAEKASILEQESTPAPKPTPGATELTTEEDELWES